MRAIIAAGGRGTRLHVLTKSKKPKSLIFLHGLPLVAWQLQVMEKLGIRRVLLSFNNQRNIREFNDLRKAGFFPDLRYETTIHGARHPLAMFRTAAAKKFCSADDILFTHGDAVFDEKFLKNFQQDAASVGTGLTAVRTPYMQWRKIRFHTTTRGLLTSFEKSSHPNYELGPVYIISRKAIAKFFEAVGEKESTLHLFTKFLKAGKKV